MRGDNLDQQCQEFGISTQVPKLKWWTATTLLLLITQRHKPWGEK